MNRFDTEAIITLIELQQMIVKVGHEIDFNQARNITNFFQDDGTYVLNGTAYQGPTAVKKFHQERCKRLRIEYPYGVPISRHTFTNFQISTEAKNLATLTFMAFYYIGAGTAEVPDSISKTNIVDCRMECRRIMNGEWRIKILENTVVLSATSLQE